MDGLSEYELERRRKMERNHRRLQELGLVGGGKPWTDPAPSKTAKPQRRGQRPTAATATGPAGAATAAVRKSVRTRRKPAVYVPPAPPASAFRGVAAVRGSSASVPVRKSLRTMSRTSPSYRDHDSDSDDDSDDLALSPDGDDDSGDDAEFVRERPGLSQAERDGWTPPPVVARPAGAPRRTSTPLAPDSSRNLECDIPMLMERFLGRQFPSFGKAPVMELSSKSCPPKFSRMSGVTEWKDAVFLWVNVDGGTGYENLFERDTSASRGVDERKAPGDDPAAAAAAAEAPVAGEASNAAGWLTAKNGRRDAAASARAPADGGPPPMGSGGGAGGGRASEAAEASTSTVAAAAAAAAAAADGRLAGLRMTWFAGGRVTAESALIQRLLLPHAPPSAAEAEEADADPISASPGAVVRRASDDDDDADEGGRGGGDDTVLLFCRLPSEPYVFCGRLGYSKHWADERPIRFVWRLLDAERLAGSPDFEAIVEVAGVE